MTTSPQPLAFPQHTTGPFYFHRSSEGCDDLWVIKSMTSDQYVATITFWDDDSEWANRAVADAHLLAAAPELLAALRKLVAAIEVSPRGHDVSVYEAEQVARVAIATAEGRE